MKSWDQYYRKIHLDFHTPHWVKNVGQDYDPEALVQTWKNAHVNAVTVVFGLCACGNAYYFSDAAPVHPGLRYDLLASLLRVARREGIAIFVHFGTGTNDRAVYEHPQWAMVNREGKPLLAGEHQWGWVCYNSPWVDEKFLPQLEDFVPRFPDVAGVFLDMVQFPTNTCYCVYCREKAVRLGLNIDTPEGLASLWRQSIDEFLAKAQGVIKRLNPEMGFTCNSLWFVGGPRIGVQDWMELEAPISWNSYHFAVVSRYIRKLPLPTSGLTTRFPKNWGYFGSLNNLEQLQFESAEALSTLGAVGVGDQLPADGVPEAGVYERIGEVFAFVKEREAWTVGAQSVPEIAILADDQHLVFGGMADYFGHQSAAAFYGSGLALLEGNRQFDVLDQRMDFRDYTGVWLPENKTLSPKVAEDLRNYVAEGGAALITGTTLWNDTTWCEALESIADVRFDGITDPAGIFLESKEPLQWGGGPLKIPGAFARFRIGPRAMAVADAIEPYEQITHRYGHFHAPMGRPAPYPGVIVASYGKGKVTVIGGALAESYFDLGSRPLRNLILSALDQMIPPARWKVALTTPSANFEVSLMAQRDRWIIHLLQFNAKRYTQNTVIEDIPERHDVGLRIRPPYPPTRVYLAPAGETLPWTEDGEAIRVVVPTLGIHAMVVVEWT